MKILQPPAVTVPGTTKGLLDWPAPVWHPVWEKGWSFGPASEPPPGVLDKQRIRGAFPGGLFPALAREDVDLDLTEEAGVTRALFWLGDMLGTETDEDRQRRTNAPSFEWDPDIGCWCFGAIEPDFYFAPQGAIFLEECEAEDGPVTPSRFVEKLVEPDLKDPWWWHKGLATLIEHVDASGVPCPKRPAHG